MLTLYSIFGSLSFGKKKADAEASPVTSPTKEAPVPEGEPVAESAPVIPAVETTEPLSTDVTSPAAAPAETTEATPATNGETKKEVKSDKRKSSLPFTFGKKEKTTSDEEGEKVKSPPFFSKLRQTVKGKGKAAEKPAEDKPAETAESKTEEEPAKDEAKPEETTPAPIEEESAEKPVPAAPAAVPAAA